VALACINGCFAALLFNKVDPVSTSKWTVVSLFYVGVSTAQKWIDQE
jgi:hypothetical protein